MGVKHLWDILENCKKTVPLHYLQNKRVCIDLSCWMVQLQNVSKSHSCVKEKVYLRGLFHRLRALIALNCSLIFVTDGSIPAIKLSTYRRRLNSGREVVQNETNSEKVSSLRRNMGSEFSCMIKEAKILGMALGIPCLNGIEEAEAQCALLNFELLCDGCFSSDSDIFLFGARTVYRDICLGDGGYVVCYDMVDIERKLGYGRDSLLKAVKIDIQLQKQHFVRFHYWQAAYCSVKIALALLLGSDYYQGVHGLGPESACQIVKSIGDKSLLQKIASEGVDFMKKSKGAKKQGHFKSKDMQDHDMHSNNGFEKKSQRDGQLMLVINAYLKPKCHQADSDIVRRVLAQHPFQRDEIHQICAEFFQWPPEKTDEYILPKIAERDLRRFANLRLTSSELGLELPLNEIPVKCPVSEIIKRRKVQGRECYEVSWEKMDGLRTSIVPANLIESACPEKILEFEEKNAQPKKQNGQKRRQKKVEARSYMAELDLKLKNLMLDIDLADCATQNVSRSTTGQGLGDTTTMVEADLNSLALMQNLELRHWKQGSSSTSNYNESDSCTAKHEVINLLSPSPLKQSKNYSKCQKPECQKPDAQSIEVINLSDSENDMSPEHNRKAKELRLFLASIRNDLH